MEPTVFTSEDILNRCVCTPTGSISATSTADTIYLDDISIDSSDTIRNDPLQDPLQEESPVLEIDEERIHAVQYPSFADRYYLAKNTKTTEWHKSCDVQRNVSLGSTGDKSCKLCPRIFNSEFNFTLHVYWHTLNEQPRGEEPYDLMEEDDSLEYEDIIDEKFDCDPTLDYSFSANDVPSFSDNFWDYWCTDTPDSPSSIGYD